MYYNYQPYPYYMRYYNISPYYYHRYYNPSPYYNYQQNIIDSQIANTDQSIINYGDMSDVIQDSNIYQLRTPEAVGLCTAPEAEPPVEEVSEPRIVPVV